MPDRAGVLNRVRCGVWGLSGRLIASYILVTLVVVVLVEVLVLCSQVAPLLIGSQLQAQLQAQVDAAAKSDAKQFAHRYPPGVPAGTSQSEAAGPMRWRSRAAWTTVRPGPFPVAASTRCGRPSRVETVAAVESRSASRS